MSGTGTVKQGVVVLPAGVALPEGVEVAWSVRDAMPPTSSHASGI